MRYRVREQGEYFYPEKYNVKTCEWESYMDVYMIHGRFKARLPVKYSSLSEARQFLKEHIVPEPIYHPYP